MFSYFSPYSKGNKEYWVNPSPISSVVIGKERDVGEALVKSLQNIKNPIDEKLEKSKISIFSQNPSSTLEAEGSKRDSDEAPKKTRDIEPLEHYQSDGEDDVAQFDEESADSDLDGSKSSDLDEGAQEDAILRSEGRNFDDENADASERPGRVMEQVEFHDGRKRRKAIFGDNTDRSSLKVINAEFFACFGRTMILFLNK